MTLRGMEYNLVITSESTGPVKIQSNKNAALSKLPQGNNTQNKCLEWDLSPSLQYIISELSVIPLDFLLINYLFITTVVKII